MDFNKKISRLDQISTSLEDSNLPLEQAIQLFDESVQIAKECHDFIADAEGKLTVIRKDLDKITEEPLN